MQKLHTLYLVGFFLLWCPSRALIAQDKKPANSQELADKLANPVATMISVPLQNNIDYGIGPYDGSKYTLNIQPVVPIQLSANFNLITRYILPVVDQRDITSEHSSQFGLSDMTVSGWVSPSQPKNGLIWGIGPALLIPTATNDWLGTKKFGMGPTALVLKQGKGVTVGFLANQLWSVAGSAERSDVNQLFLQPFFSRSFPSGASLGGNMEMTQNWEANTTLLFFNPIVSGVTKIGRQLIQTAIGPRIPLAGPKSSKPDFGLRAVVIFVFAQ